MGKAGLGHQLPLGLPDAHLVGHQLGHALIHTGGAGRDMGPHIGQARNLQEALNRAVLTAGAVEHREDHVDPLPDHAVVLKAQQALAVDRRQRRPAVALAALPSAGRKLL